MRLALIIGGCVVGAAAVFLTGYKVGAVRAANTND
jgi:hypothetical protein